MTVKAKMLKALNKWLQPRTRRRQSQTKTRPATQADLDHFRELKQKTKPARS